MLRIGIDTGGTFTDFVLVEAGRIRTWKEPSTPQDPSLAILAGLRHLAGPATGAEIIHGSTVATNALLEGKGARVAFVTNRGFEDLLEIGRQSRPALYDLDVERPAAIVPRERRFGLAGRILVDGSVEAPLDARDLERTADMIRAGGAESIAICLLHSWRNASHEEDAARALSVAGLPVSRSSRLVSEYREYERASTTVVNAAVAPVMSRYLSRLESEFDDALPGAAASIRIMGSNGGALSPAAAGEEAVRTVLSGPAAGVTAARWCGHAMGRRRCISFDMGGTSTDVSLVDGEARMTTEGFIAGHPVKVPMIDIHTVGAGGGSIAWRDPGGALKVGPVSAGADPGPACYGRGGPATVTDANLVLGRIVPERFLDGRMRLDIAAARTAVEAIGRECGLGLAAAAEGIVTVAEATMVRAIRVISLYRGYEPSGFTLLAFGGAGGLHAASIATALDMEHGVIPANPGVFSALGMTVADVVRDRSAGFPADAEPHPGNLEEIFVGLERACAEDLEADKVPPSRRRFERSLDVRYRGQSWELSIPYDRDPERWRGAFHDEHRRRFGHDRRGRPVDVVTLRVRGVGEVDPIAPAAPAPAGRSPGASRTGEGPVICGGVELVAPHHERSLLPLCGGPGDPGSVDGPALVCESGATTFIPPGWCGWLDGLGHLHLEGGRRREVAG